MEAVELTLTYVSDEGEVIALTRSVTWEGLAAVLMTIDEHTTDEE